MYLAAWRRCWPEVTYRCHLRSLAQGGPARMSEPSRTGALQYPECRAPAGPTPAQRWRGIAAQRRPASIQRPHRGRHLRLPDPINRSPTSPTSGSSGSPSSVVSQRIRGGRLKAQVKASGTVLEPHRPDRVIEPHRLANRDHIRDSSAAEPALGLPRIALTWCSAAWTTSSNCPADPAALGHGDADPAAQESGAGMSHPARSPAARSNAAHASVTASATSGHVCSACIIGGCLWHGRIAWESR
jgi:hypothetical protein